MTDNRTTELLHVGDILWNEPCDERIVVVAANERNVWLRKVQKNDELAMHDGHVWSMLGKKCNVKNMCTQSYAQSAFELDGHVEQAIAATLGRPKVKKVRGMTYDEHGGEVYYLACSGCGEWIDGDLDCIGENDGPNFCGNCGGEFDGPLLCKRCGELADMEFGDMCAECYWGEGEGYDER